MSERLTDLQKLKEVLLNQAERGIKTGDWPEAEATIRSSARRERDSLTTPPGCRSFLLFRRPFGWAQRGGFR